jgi:hypothetical protein
MLRLVLGHYVWDAVYDAEQKHRLVILNNIYTSIQ